jgi:hypothetical protein
VAAPFPHDVAGPVDEPKSKTARAPIDRDICSLAHLKSVPDAIRATGAWYHAGLPAGYARFVIDLRKRSQHDPKSCDATLFSAAWFRQRAHVRNNAAKQQKQRLWRTHRDQSSL